LISSIVKLETTSIWTPDTVYGEQMYNGAIILDAKIVLKLKSEINQYEEGDIQSGETDIRCILEIENTTVNFNQVIGTHEDPSWSSIKDPNAIFFPVWLYDKKSRNLIAGWNISYHNGIFPFNALIDYEKKLLSRCERFRI